MYHIAHTGSLMLVKSVRSIDVFSKLGKRMERSIITLFWTPHSLHDFSPSSMVETTALPNFLPELLFACGVRSFEFTACGHVLTWYTNVPDRDSRDNGFSDGCLLIRLLLAV